MFGLQKFVGFEVSDRPPWRQVVPMRVKQTYLLFADFGNCGVRCEEVSSAVNKVRPREFVRIGFPTLDVVGEYLRSVAAQRSVHFDRVSLGLQIFYELSDSFIRSRAKVIDLALTNVER